MNQARNRLTVAALLWLGAAGIGQGRPMTWRDVMQFRELHAPQLSADGRLVVYETRPDRGDGELVVRVVASGAEQRIPRGRDAQISADGRYVACRVEPPFDSPNPVPRGATRPGMAVLEVTTGTIEQVLDVQRFGFTADGGAIIHLHGREQPADQNRVGRSEPAQRPGSRLVVRSLISTERTALFDIVDFAIANSTGRIAYSTAATDDDHTLVVRELVDGRLGDGRLVHSATGGRYHLLTWDQSGTRLAFVHYALDAARLGIWLDDGATRWLVDAESLPPGLTIASTGILRFAKATPRLFFPTRAVTAESPQTPAEGAQNDPFDLDTILADRAVDVWHVADPRIVPHQKTDWDKQSRRTFVAMHDLERDRTIVLTDPSLPEWIDSHSDAPRVLAANPAPYLREASWDDAHRDVSVIDLTTGARRRVLDHQAGPTAIAPDGRSMVAWLDGHWHLRNLDQDASRNLTADLGVPFADEDWDQPSDRPGYGIAGWSADGATLLLHDKYDVWSFPTRGGAATNLTAGCGRRERVSFRVVDHALDGDPDGDGFERDEPILLTMAGEWSKRTGFARIMLDRPGVDVLLEDACTFRLVGRSETGDRMLFSRESYDEFPDLWLAGPDFADPIKVSDLDAQRAPFAWGTSRLIEWRNLDGRRMQGTLLLPSDHQPGRQLPVLVHCDRSASQRVHEWGAVKLDDRPCFPFYVSNGYAVFLPDVRFEVGRPGLSATKCIVPGVNALIEQGIADPQAIALHGHSWGGYQTAFVITQCELFACAIAGAPVSNMTSAYGGVGWESGMSRQFEYEKAQSRIGGSLWTAFDDYVENSPLFSADRIRTPLLIECGDADGVVSWHQCIELFMAMRRLDQPCVLLQYRGEPHHLQRYADKLDYAMRMSQWLDHHCRGAAAPAWIAEGVPYAGR